MIFWKIYDFLTFFSFTIKTITNSILTSFSCLLISYDVSFCTGLFIRHFISINVSVYHGQICAVKFLADATGRCTLVHSYDMCTSWSYIPIYSHSEITQSIWMVLVVDQLSLATVAHHFISSPIPLALAWYFPSKHLFGERLFNCGNVLLLTLVGGISLPLPLNLILLSHKITCSGGCSGRFAQIHCKDKLEHLLLP